MYGLPWGDESTSKIYKYQTKDHWITFATLGLEERLIGKARERIIISLNQPPTHHIASATDALYTLEMEGKDIKE